MRSLVCSTQNELELQTQDFIKMSSGHCMAKDTVHPKIRVAVTFLFFITDEA